MNKKKPVRWKTPEDTNKYEEFISNNIPSSVNTLNIGNMCNTLNDLIEEAQNQHCTKINDRNKKLSENTVNFMKRRHDMRGNPNVSTTQLRTLNKEISREVRTDVRKFNTKHIKETTENNKNRKILRKKLSNGKKEIFRLKDKNGMVSTDRQTLLKITEEFYRTLYKSQQRDGRRTKIRCKKLINQNSEELLDINVSETKQTLTEMKIIDHQEKME